MPSPMIKKTKPLPHPAPEPAFDAGPDSAALEAVARAESRTVTVDGNRLSLLPDGPERLDALVALIDGADYSLRLLYYIFTNDASGQRVLDALMRARARGIDVALLIDGFGSAKTPDNFFSGLHDAGARFCRFLPSYGRRYLIRNHQKLALADESRVMIGGFNVEDDYFGTREDGAWRDLGLMVEGPAAARLAPYFDQLMVWALAKGSRIRELRTIIAQHSEHYGKLQWLFGGPMRRLSPWAQATCRDLAQAQDVEMIAAYFAPTGGMLRRIARIGNRGRARVITAARSDNSATIAAARWTYSRLLRRGVEVYEYRPTKLHSKLVVLDDVVHIGSSNFDIRSLYLNLEMTLRVDDPEFAQMMRAYVEHELQDCLQITRELHRMRGTLFNRIKWAVSFYLVTAVDYGVTRRANFNFRSE